MNNISHRLKTIYDMVETNNRVCDLCSDHGLIPIKLIKDNKSNYVIATDIAKSSIDKINNNINLYLDNEQSKKIDVRIGDGLSIIDYNDFDILIISGIGCDLMINILKNIDKYNYKYLLLSPQTKIDKFRQYLIDNNLYIQDEKIVYEDNQYYFILKVIKNKDNLNIDYKDYELLYSKHLLQKKDEVLHDYINKQLSQYNDILDKLKESNAIDNDAKKNYEYLYELTKNILNKW